MEWVQSAAEAVTRGCSLIIPPSCATRSYSAIVETTSASVPSTVTFNIHGNLSNKPVHVWATNLNSTSDKDLFVHVNDVKPEGSGRYQFTVQPNYV